MAMALLAAGAASAQVEARPADGGGYNTVLEIGPIGGLTTIWHRSPLATAIPLGSEVDFRVKGPGAGEARWSGATIVQQSSHRFLAHWRMDQVGEHVVSVELERNGSVVRESIRFDVIDVPASSITVSDIAFDYHEVDLGEDDRNAAAMAYFFRDDSVADVEELSPGRILTSTWRWLELSASVEPAAFAPLLEWRHDSGPLRILGGVELRLFGPGVHRIEAGPAGQASALEVESYMVFVRDEAGGDTLDLTGINRLVAETHPPGYEDRVVWTASSKHGTADPVHGVGPTFDVSFANANGPEGHWVGIKADYVERSLDGKGETTPIEQIEGVCNDQMADELLRAAEVFGVELAMETFATGSVSDVLLAAAASREDPRDLVGFFRVPERLPCSEQLPRGFYFVDVTTDDEGNGDASFFDLQGTAVLTTPVFALPPLSPDLEPFLPPVSLHGFDLFFDIFSCRMCKWKPSGNVLVASCFTIEYTEPSCLRFVPPG